MPPPALRPALLAALLLPRLAAAAPACRSPLESGECLFIYAGLASVFALVPTLLAIPLVLVAGLLGRRPLLRIGAGLLAVPLASELAALVAVALFEALGLTGHSGAEYGPALRRNAALTFTIAGVAALAMFAAWWRWSRRPAPADA